MRKTSAVAVATVVATTGLVGTSFGAAGTSHVTASKKVVITDPKGDVQTVHDHKSGKPRKADDLRKVTFQRGKKYFTITFKDQAFVSSVGKHTIYSYEVLFQNTKNDQDGYATIVDSKDSDPYQPPYFAYKDKSKSCPGITLSAHKKAKDWVEQIPMKCLKKHLPTSLTLFGNQSRDVFASGSDSHNVLFTDDFGD